MCHLHIHAQSYGRVFEVFPEQVASTELLVEEGVSHVLFDLFDETTVDDVTVRFSPVTSAGQRECSIDIHAQCSIQSFTLLSRTKEEIELTVGERICSLLKQLFGPVILDSITIQPFCLQSR